MSNHALFLIFLFCFIISQSTKDDDKLMFKSLDFSLRKRVYERSLEVCLSILPQSKYCADAGSQDPWSGFVF